MKHQKHFFKLLIITLIAVAFGIAQSSDSKRDRTFSVGKSCSLETSVSGGDLVIKTWDKNEINVSIDGLDDEDLEYVRMEQSGNTVRVTYRPRWSHWGGGNNARFTMTVPTQCEVNLKTSGGDIDLEGNLMADAHGSTSGGDITIERIKGSVNMAILKPETSMGKRIFGPPVEISGSRQSMAKQASAHRVAILPLKKLERDSMHAHRVVMLRSAISEEMHLFRQREEK